MRIVNLVENTQGADGCGYEHGLSFYIETDSHKLLSDCGASEMFLENAKVLGIDLTQVDTCVLSHGHYDHSGGIMAFAAMNPNARIYAQKTAGDDYYHIAEGIEDYIGIDKDILKLPQYVPVDGDRKLDDELFLFSGITGRKCPAKGNLELKKKIEGEYVQDDFAHEQCLVITQGKKRILLSGCAHNGILNIMDRYEEIFHSYPDVVISGFHMMKREEHTADEIETIQFVARELMQTGAVFYSGHCTGQPAYDVMKEIMGESLQQLHSGLILENME